MQTPPEDKRPPMAIAMEWVSKITSVSVMMVLPAVVGYWADSRWGSGPWLLVLGATAGLAIFLTQLLQMVGDPRRKKNGDANRQTH